jgi:hypothetical protein
MSDARGELRRLAGGDEASRGKVFLSLLSSLTSEKICLCVFSFRSESSSGRLIKDLDGKSRGPGTSERSQCRSGIHQVVSKRVVKKQQMRWTDRGAHLLLQVRTRVLNEEWRSTLSHWYPAMQETSDAKAA